ncbi:MAG: DUF1801 domain-containing protein [Bacteroidota bacterium]
MAKNKTVETTASVNDFLATVTDDSRKQDCFTIVKLMEELSGFKAKMWGPAIIGCGFYHYKYASGHEGDMPLIAFSPRKNDLTIYLEASFDNKDELLERLGKHKTGKVCLYIKKLADVDMEVLKELMALSLKKSNL